MTTATEAITNKFLTCRTLQALEKYHDPLYRAPGASLDPRRFSEETLRRMRGALGPRAWSALWMQDPRVQGGGLIDRKEHFLSSDVNKRRVLSPNAFREATKDLRWGRGWDFAFTAQQFNKPDPDWTVGALMAFKIDDDTETYDIYIKDIVRFRENWGESKRRIRDTAIEDGVDVAIGGEAFGPQSAALQDIEGMPSLARYTKVRVPLAADKSARAQLWASQAQARRVWLCEAIWNGVFFDEGEAFPNGAHDDIVDGCSVGYVLAAMISDGLDSEIMEADEPEIMRAW
jgi:predicted phage terminase large subunit-like protein